MRRPLLLLAATTLVGALLPLSGAAARPLSDPCAAAEADRVSVRGAEEQRATCLSDLTTAGLLAASQRDGFDYTVAADWAGLHAKDTVNPTGVAGLQIDGYFSDTSTTNPFHGWNHDAQFVIRLPEKWNGRLVVAGAPGVRRQYSSDFLVSDYVLAQGFAYASIDKGNGGALFFSDGARPGDAIREWHARTSQVTEAAQRVVKQAYGRPARSTYMTGISNGGYLTRWQLENRPDLFDGGVDWEGNLFEEDNNLLTYLPDALRAYPVYADPDSTPAEKEAARQAMYDAGFEPGSEFLWGLHHELYWDLTQRIYREELDPAADGSLQAGITPTCTLGTKGCATADIEYDLDARPEAVREAFEGITLTGKIKRPMVSLHGDLDALLPIDLHGDRYRELVEQAHRARLHRYYVVERGQHVDGFYDRPGIGEQVRPILPCYREAFDALVSWVERREQPPASGPVERRSADVVNDCTL